MVMNENHIRIFEDNISVRVSSIIPESSLPVIEDSEMFFETNEEYENEMNEWFAELFK